VTDRQTCGWTDDRHVTTKTYRVIKTTAHWIQLPFEIVGRVGEKNGVYEGGPRFSDGKEQKVVGGGMGGIMYRYLGCSISRARTTEPIGIWPVSK